MVAPSPIWRECEQEIADLKLRVKELEYSVQLLWARVGGVKVGHGTPQTEDFEPIPIPGMDDPAFQTRSRDPRNVRRRDELIYNAVKCGHSYSAIGRAVGWYHTSVMDAFKRESQRRIAGQSAEAPSAEIPELSEDPLDGVRLKDYLEAAEECEKEKLEYENKSR